MAPTAPSGTASPVRMGTHGSTDGCAGPLASRLLQTTRTLLLLLLLLARAALCIITLAAASETSDHSYGETGTLQGIPDLTVPTGKIFSYPVPACAFQGVVTKCKVTLASGADLPKWLEFSPKTQQLQGLPVAGERGDYLLSVATTARARPAPRATGKLTIHVEDGSSFPGEGGTWNHMANSSRSLKDRKEQLQNKYVNIMASEQCHCTYNYSEKENKLKKGVNDDPSIPCLNGMGNCSISYKVLETKSVSADRCGKGVPVTSAEIILQAAAESLRVQERLYLARTMAEYLHLDPSSVTLLQYMEPARRRSQKVVVLAEDTARIGASAEDHYVGLCWPVKCGSVVLHHFAQVLRHNIESHHLSELLGYEIAGWRILKIGGHGRKSLRRQRRRLMITPTPTLEPMRITERPCRGDAPRPWASAVLDSLLTSLRPSPAQRSASLCDESITMASYTMENKIHLGGQESAVTVGTDSLQKLMTKPPERDPSNSPDLSPSLISKTFSFTELEVLPTGASSIFVLVEQPAPHVPKTELYLLAEKSEVSKFLLLQEITSSTAQFPRCGYTLMMSTFHQRPDSSAKAMPSKTEFPLPETMSMSEVPNHKDQEKTHFPEFKVLSAASLSPETPPSAFPDSSVRATASSEFAFPTDDMFLLLPGSGSLSQELVNVCEQLSRPFTSIPWPHRLPFTAGKSMVPPVIQTEAQTLSPQMKCSPESSICFSNILFNAFPNEAGTLYEPSLIIPSHPDNAPVPTLPSDFSSVELSELSTSTRRSVSYNSSMLTAQTWAASTLFSGSKDLHSDKGLGTRVILPNATEATLAWSRVSDLISSTAEAPLMAPFSITSHLSSSRPELVETVLPSLQDRSTLLLPTDEALQSTDAAWTHSSSSTSRAPENKTTGQANTFPKIAHSIELITATIGCLFFFPIPANTFYDEEDGNSSQLALEIIPADGSPAGLGSWLQLDASRQAMHSYPLDVDFQYSPQEFILAATDSGGLTARESFIIELLRPTSVPCHLCTIRIKTSYFSFLRDRKRVSLFLEKLSLYLNSSTSQDIAVTALKPSSTLISWYSPSLCSSANGSPSQCAKAKIQEALEKLRAPDGSVSPDFVRAMLPEYKIDVIISISYSKICFATTEPLNGSVNSTVAACHDGNGFGKMVPAFAITLSVAAALALIIAAVCSCKYYREVLGSRSMVFQRTPPPHCGALEMDILEMDARTHGKAPSHSHGTAASAAPCTEADPARGLRSGAAVRPPRVPASPPPKYQLPPPYPSAPASQGNRGDVQPCKVMSFK